jgi:hypothetical protein
VLTTLESCEEAVVDEDDPIVLNAYALDELTLRP